MPVFPTLRRQEPSASPARWGPSRHAQLDAGQVEDEVYKTIYGWRTGAVERIQPVESTLPDDAEAETAPAEVGTASTQTVRRQRVAA